MTTDPTDAIRLIQSGLEKLGHTPGAIDGRWGVRTARALRQLIATNGQAASIAPQGPLPWITDAKTALGRNEARDRPWLMDWLKRDGRSLDDPGKNPWTCREFVLPQVLFQATLRSKATGLFQPRAECRRRGL